MFMSAANQLHRSKQRTDDDNEGDEETREPFTLKCRSTKCKCEIPFVIPLQVPSPVAVGAGDLHVGIVDQKRSAAAADDDSQVTHQLIMSSIDWSDNNGMNDDIRRSLMSTTLPSTDMKSPLPSRKSLSMSDYIPYRRALARNRSDPIPFTIEEIIYVTNSLVNTLHYANMKLCVHRSKSFLLRLLPPCNALI
jgi:hypothetical protein